MVTCRNNVGPRIASQHEGREETGGDGPRPPGVMAGAESHAGLVSAASLAMPLSRAALILWARSSGTVTTSWR
jgi:hypothetical protein